MASMCLLAIAFVAFALLRKQRKQVLATAVVVIFVVASSLGLYGWLGSPDVRSGAGQQPDIGDMVTSLAARLQQQPDDVNGWKMLGRSYMTLADYRGAVSAYEKAVELESALNAQTLVDLAVAIAQADGQQLSPRAVSAFENALAIDPNHPEAMFYGGIAAFNRGDVALAADRWERLLATNPPPEVRAIIEERIAAWRGEPLSQAALPSEPADVPGTEAVISAAVSISDAALQALPDGATVFVIARDPKQPSPPIAVTRRSLSDLPTVVTLGDRDAMIPGRALTAFPEFELVVRASASGTPAERPGDWFVATIVRPADGAEISVTINTEVR